MASQSQSQIPDTYIRELASKQGWNDSTLLDITLSWVCNDPGRYAKYILALNNVAVEEERLMVNEDLFSDENEDETNENSDEH